MTVQHCIEEKLQQAFTLQHVKVENESHMHGGPATESHFKITAVSVAFHELSPLQRHRKVYDLLDKELAGGVHALALHLYTPAEWQKRHQVIPESPDCRGGSIEKH